jgi:hypothetical protein
MQEVKRRKSRACAAFTLRLGTYLPARETHLDQPAIIRGINLTLHVLALLCV